MMDYGFTIERKNRGYGRPYYGKYRGKVLNNNDPLNMGRVKCSCPSILGPNGELDWASPCLPPGFKGVPNVGDLVWLEFEEGDPNRPIWTGIWFLEGKYTPDGIQLPAYETKVGEINVTEKVNEFEQRISSLESKAHTH